MAFPMDTEELIALLRVSWLTMAGADEEVRRTMKPMRGRHARRFIGERGAVQIDEEMGESPPIALNMGQREKEMAMGRVETPERKRASKQKRRQDHHMVGRGHRGHRGGAPGAPGGKRVGVLEEQNSVVGLTAETTAETTAGSTADGLAYSRTIWGKKGKTRGQSDRGGKVNRDKLKGRRVSDSDSFSDSDDDAGDAVLFSLNRNLDLIEEQADESENNDGESTEVPIGEDMVQSDSFTTDSDLNMPLSSEYQANKVGELSGQTQKFTKFSSSESDIGPHKSSSDSDAFYGLISLEDDVYDQEVEYDEDDDEEEEEEEYDDDDDDDDTSTLESAFTDIETDSLLNSPDLFDSYNDYDLYNLANRSGQIPSLRSDSKKVRKKKSKTNCLENQASGKTSFTSRSSHLSLADAPSSTRVSQSSTKSPLDTSLTTPHGQPTSKNAISFEKVDLSERPLVLNSGGQSNLSTLLQFKSKSSHMNPLSYYTFANSTGGSTIELNIFLPPDSKAFTRITINQNIAISDCIGYILLCLSKIKAFTEKMGDDSNYMNPNLWRLELVDEDGENYGSFGILDRTRILSTYNGPKDLALCKVNDSNEVLKNERQTPLPLEFKQSLLAYYKKPKLGTASSPSFYPSVPKLFDEGSAHLVELKISMQNVEGVSLNNGKTNLTVLLPSSNKVGSLLQKICSENGLDSTKYKLRSLLPRDKTTIEFKKDNMRDGTLLANSLADNLSPSVMYMGRSLTNSDLLSTLESNMLELVPLDATAAAPTNASDNANDRNLGITPSDTTLTHLTSSPPSSKPVEERISSVSLDEDNKKPRAVAKKSGRYSKDATNNSTNSKPPLNSDKYLDDIMAGKNPQLPTNINTIYFKWTVWRRKPTYINKIEKSLVIDGDYIHLTPSDVTVWKTNQNDNPFITGQQGHSQSSHHHHHNHHHHLHHYNYSNYYMSLAMKTSSFHISQITKLKRYLQSKNPSHFKVVIKKQVDNSNTKEYVKKKYDLEAANTSECEEIIKKINWVLQLYTFSNVS